MNETVISRLAAQALASPEKIAVRLFGAAGERAMSYQELHKQAGAIAGILESRGVERGQVVLIVLRTSTDLVASFFGAILCGAVPSIMPPPSPKQLPEIYWSGHRELFNKIRPAAIVTDDRIGELYRDNLPEFAGILCATVECAVANPFRPVEADPEAAVFLQHSSGTTALKKGVIISHRAALEHADRYAAVLGFTAADVIASWLPLYHDMGLVACLLLPILRGASVVMIDPFEWLVRPWLLLEAIDRFNATFCWMPNFAFERMAAMTPTSARHNLASLRAVINCSEPCKQSSHQKFIDRFAAAGLSPLSAQVSYAMAENVFAVSQTQLGAPVKTLRLKPHSVRDRVVELAEPDAPALEVVSCGRLLPQTQVRIVDEARMELTSGHIGEIAIKTDTLFDGYHRRPELTQAALAEGWYFTRDIGFLHDGELHVLGRTDDLLIVRGENFLAHELEQEIAEVPGIKAGRAVVFSADGSNLGTQQLVVLFEPDGSAPPEQTCRQIRERLDAAAGIVPGRVQWVEPGLLRKSTSGKISRAANRQWFEAGLQTQPAAGTDPRHTTDDRHDTV